MLKSNFLAFAQLVPQSPSTRHSRLELLPDTHHEFDGEAVAAITRF
jgi:hypothetical protein